MFYFMLITVTFNIFAQKNLPRLSPKSFVGQTIGYAHVNIEYGTPGVKGRTIWGELVSYNKVWRTGANEATTIEFNKDVTVEGQKVTAGKYALFTIPGKKTWTIILNKIYDQWGAFKYNQLEDIIRFKVIHVKNHSVERLKFSFDFIEPYLSKINFEWAELKFSFTINSKTESSK